MNGFQDKKSRLSPEQFKHKKSKSPSAREGKKKKSKDQCTRLLNCKKRGGGEGPLTNWSGSSGASRNPSSSAL